MGDGRMLPAIVHSLHNVPLRICRINLPYSRLCQIIRWIWTYITKEDIPYKSPDSFYSWHWKDALFISTDNCTDGVIHTQTQIISNWISTIIPGISLFSIYCSLKLSINNKTWKRHSYPYPIFQSTICLNWMKLPSPSSSHECKQPGKFATHLMVAFILSAWVIPICTRVLSLCTPYTFSGFYLSSVVTVRQHLTNFPRQID